MAPTPLEGDPVRKGSRHALLRLGDPGQVAAIERDGVAQVQQAEAVVAHVAVLRRQRVGRRRRNQELRVLPVGLSADHRPLGLEPQDVLEAVRGVGRRPHAVGVPRRVRGPVPARPGPGVRAELVGKQPVPTQRRPARSPRPGLAGRSLPRPRSPRTPPSRGTRPCRERSRRPRARPACQPRFGCSGRRSSRAAGCCRAADRSRPSPPRSSPA